MRSGEMGHQDRDALAKLCKILGLQVRIQREDCMAAAGTIRPWPAAHLWIRWRLPFVLHELWIRPQLAWYLLLLGTLISSNHLIASIWNCKAGKEGSESKHWRRKTGSEHDRRTSGWRGNSFHNCRYHQYLPSKESKNAFKGKVHAIMLCVWLVLLP